MCWYRIEFFNYSPLSVKVHVNNAFAMQHRIALVERQYSTFNRAVAAADKMQRRYLDCAGYTLTVL